MINRTENPESRQAGVDGFLLFHVFCMYVPRVKVTCTICFFKAIGGNVLAFFYNSLTHIRSFPSLGYYSKMCFAETYTGMVQSLNIEGERFLFLTN